MAKQGKAVDGPHPHSRGLCAAGAPAILSVSVVPGASKSEIVGVEGGALKVRLAAPPVEGKANRELVRLLARALGVRGSDVEIVAGHRARLKKVQVYGADPNTVSRLMGSTSEPLEQKRKRY